ncbi:MAG: hypothetical protein IPO83_03815 [Chitinophagaceae bacterium]|nr:hypothetical protein [Chitinophagaceae bacterium]
MDEPLLDVFDIQANIAPGFRLPHQWVMGFAGSFISLKEVLKYLAPKLTSMQQAYEYHKVRKRLSIEKGIFGLKSFKLHEEAEILWFNLAIGRDLLKELKLLAPEMQDASFAAGMYNRSFHLGDPRNEGEQGHRDGWKFGNPEKTISLLLIVGSSKESSLLEQADIFEKKFHKLIIYSEAGNRLENDTEHFGFKDGVSQPRHTRICL